MALFANHRAIDEGGNAKVSWVNLKGDKLAMADLIAKIVADWSGGRGDPRPLVSIAQRESNFTPTAAADVAAATKVWQRLKPQYVAHGNPWTNEDASFGASRGLYQLMVPYQLKRWDWTAHPLTLEHPVIATVVAGRIINNAIALGAKTPVDVRMVWAYGGDGLSIPKTDERYTDRVKKEQDRMESLGFPRDLALAPVASMGYEAFGKEAQTGQEQKAAAISSRLGLALWPGASSTTPKQQMGGSMVTILALGLLAWGVLRG